MGLWIYFGDTDMISLFVQMICPKKRRTALGLENK